MGVAVTGVGVVTAIGNNVAENLDSLRDQRTGIAPLGDAIATRKPYLAAQVKLSDSEIKSALALDNNSNFPRTALLSLKAATECVSGINFDLNSDLRTGLISSTTTGGMDRSELFYKDYILNDDANDIHFLANHDNGKSTTILANHLGIKEHIYTLSTACSSSANAILTGSRMIQAGLVDRIIVGGSDALTNFTINGFDSLMIYDPELCKPFDDTRKGLNLGEGAGYIMLESERSLALTQNKVIGHVLGWANTNDAYHQTASSPDGKGATLAIEQALEIARISKNDIDYVNAHGTATPNNDLSESIALINVFGKDVPPFSSTKGYTGHTLAASGIIEAIYCFLAIEHGEFFANINFQTPIQDTGLTPILNHNKGEIKFALSNSFGFGGNCSSLIFGK